MNKPQKTLHRLDELHAEGFVSADEATRLAPVAARYAIAITPAMADLIEDADDPIARQFVPSVNELDVAANEHADPIGDDRHSPVTGIVHRYTDRVLLKLTSVCPVYCRFCFRREMVGANAEAGALTQKQIDDALAYIEAHDEIWEVVLTGGDPFLLSPRRMAQLGERLGAIAHVKVLRWHTRVPAVEPARVTSAMIGALRTFPRAVFVVLHTNHAKELTDDARAACALLVDGGIPMLSQSVLLKGVNDSAQKLEDLMRALVETRIKPYYLHHGDLAPGTAHFRTTIEEGQQLTRDLRNRASGLCQPAYVLDIPGGYAKARLDLSDAEQTETGHALRDGAGRIHHYDKA